MSQSPFLLVIDADNRISGRNPSNPDHPGAGKGAVVREKADLAGEHPLGPEKHLVQVDRCARRARYLQREVVVGYEPQPS